MLRLRNKLLNAIRIREAAADYPDAIVHVHGFLIARSVLARRRA